MLIYNVPTWINYAYIGGVSVFAIVRGGPNERILGVVQSFALLNGATGSPLDLPDWTEDSIALAFGLYVTTRSQRAWPIFASAAYLLMIMTDVVYRLHPMTHLWSYLSAQLTWTYLAATALLWGTVTRRPSGLPR